MPQGDASQYPILPISLSIMGFCYIISFLISLLADYLSKSDQKKMIENRVKSDFKRLKEFLQSQKLEKFNPDEAKNRLTIITNLLMERINSNQIGVIETVPKIDRDTKSDKTAKVEEIKKEEIVDNFKLESQQTKSLNEISESVVKTEKSEKKVLIMNEPRLKEATESQKKIKNNSVEKKSSTFATSQVITSNSKTIELSDPKSQPVENYNDRVILTKETTIEDIIKKLSLAPRSATVFIEIREAKERESSPKETRGSTIKFTPPSTIGTVESDFKLNSDEINSSSNSKLNDKQNNYSKQNSDLMEIVNRKSALNQNLSKTFRDNQSKMIQERLKLDAEFRKTRHMAPKKNRWDENNKFSKYDDNDDDDDSESQAIVMKQSSIEILENFKISFIKFVIFTDATRIFGLFFRNAFDLVQNCQVEQEIKTDKSIKSVRQTVNEMSIGGGQGMLTLLSIFRYYQKKTITYTILSLETKLSRQSFGQRNKQTRLEWCHIGIVCQKSGKRETREQFHVLTMKCLELNCEEHPPQWQSRLSAG
ncbi:hypothetical protein BpHYR1_036874 [Brachionus plicatilis]|uniref:Uncharacterized protein n=1 Tax=Brachionus plicatilis TaxID=10195 RepID=A0A3M7R0G8_BRAPC|nr:hypothetical protein BpHYR1_036874 [Brachionus plicatilis]